MGRVVVAEGLEAEGYEGGGGEGVPVHVDLFGDEGGMRGWIGGCIIIR